MILILNEDLVNTFSKDQCTRVVYIPSDVRNKLYGKLIFILQTCDHLLSDIDKEICKFVRKKR